MAMQDEPLTQAQSSLQRMSMQAEQAIEATEPSDAQSHLQEAIRFGEQARGYLEETLDSTDEERVIIHTEQALDATEEALDQANQALFASEATNREHMEQMGVNVEQALAQLEMATEMEVG